MIALLFGEKALRNRVKKAFCVCLAGIAVVFACMAPQCRAVAAEDSMARMYRRAVDFPPGDLSRLAHVLEKAERGEEVTIGFIGGSITEGHAASSMQNCYVSRVYRWWCDTFPEATIHLVNAGVGGTSSYLGVHRVDSELLAYAPDLVFIEFAVNDTYTEFCLTSYENLIRRILQSDSSPAVVLLFAINAVGGTVQEVQASIGEYYKLPMVSYGNAVIPEVAAGSIAWSEIARDIVHPNDEGHALFAEFITTYLEEVYKQLDTIVIDEEQLGKYELPAPVTPQIYQEAHIENAKTITPVEMSGFEECDYNYHFLHNWGTKEDGAAISFEVEARNIGILYQRTVEGYYGQYDVYVDGRYAGTLDGNYVEGYGTETDTEELYTAPDGEKAVHTVKIVKNPGSNSNFFVVVGLLLS